MRRILASLLLACVVLTSGYTETVRPTQRSTQTIQSRSPRLPRSAPKSYTNRDGNRVPSPRKSPTRPLGATAHCRDGTWSFSQHRSGTCSHHGGVAEW